MILETIVTLAGLLDFNTLVAEGGMRILLCELRQAPGDTTRLERAWHLWSCDSGEGGSSEIGQWPSAVAPLSRFDVDFADGALFVLIESNRENALQLVRFDGRGDSSGTRSMTELATVNMSSPAKLSGRDTWSVPMEFVQPAHVLFMPFLCASSRSGHIACAVSADGHTRVFRIADNNTVDQVGVYERYIRPFFCELDGERILIAQRRPETDWRVYENCSRSAIPSRLLPLHLMRLDKSYRVVQTKDLSDGSRTGPSFIFDACVADKNRIVVATVGNVVKKPVLQVLVSLDGGRDWASKGTVDLSVMPKRLSVAAHGDEAVVALTSNMARVELARFAID